MHFKTSWVIQTKSLLSLLECIDFWALTGIFWGSKAEPVCVGEGDKKNNSNNMPCFQLCSALLVPLTEWLKFTAQMKAEVTSSLCSSCHQIEIYWKLCCHDNFATVLLVIDRWEGSRCSALVGLTYITLVVLFSEFFLIMVWHKRRGFLWVTDWGDAGTHSHFSQSVASLTLREMITCHTGCTSSIRLVMVVFRKYLIVTRFTW